MKILLVEIAPAGGLFQFALQLGDALARNGCQTELLCGRNPEFEPGEPGLLLSPKLRTWQQASGSPNTTASGTVNAAAHRIRRVWRGLLYCWAWIQIARRVLRDPPDVVIFADWRFWIDGIAAWVLGRLARRRAPTLFVDIAHTPVPMNATDPGGTDYRTGPLLTRSLRAGYRSLDLVVVLGESSRSQFHDAWGHDIPTAVMPHGTEDIFDAAGIGPAGDAPPNVLLFGTWNRYKGIGVLLDAFETVRAEMPSAALTIAGMPDRDVVLDEIGTRADRIGNVTLIAEYVDSADVHGLFDQARVVALPYLFANQSGVAHLAANFARPVVASRIGDLPEVVDDSETGILTEPGDSDALAAGLLELLSDRDTATRMGDTARERILTRSSWDDSAQLLIGALENADPLTRRARRRA